MLLLESTACFLQISCLTYSSTLKMGAVFISETLADLYRAAWRYIQEHGPL
jgi:hypothetical protein